MLQGAIRAMGWTGMVDLRPRSKSCVQKTYDGFVARSSGPDRWPERLDYAVIFYEAVEPTNALGMTQGHLSPHIHHDIK